MIKVISGRRYNTEKAEQVYHWWNGQYSSDFRYRQKTLYRTASGSWFFHHSGGPLSDMGVACGNGLGGSESIEPCSDSEAYDFLERNSDDSDAMEAIEKYFANQVQDA